MYSARFLFYSNDMQEDNCQVSFMYAYVECVHFTIHNTVKYNKQL